VLVVHRRQVRVPVPRRGDGVAPERVHEGEEHGPEQLQVGQLLGALLGGAAAALHAAALGGVQGAPGREHGPVQRERCLVEPQPLQRDQHAGGEVGGEARRQERAEDGGEDAEADEDDEEVVVVALQPHVGAGVVGEEEELRRERRRRHQAQLTVRQRQVPAVVAVAESLSCRVKSA
jgi:hypothetical protein